MSASSSKRSRSVDETGWARAVRQLRFVGTIEDPVVIDDSDDDSDDDEGLQEKLFV